MKNTCDRPPTNAEMFYKIFHEWLDFCWKFIKLIFKSKWHSTVFIFVISFAILFVSAKINFKDCVDVAKQLLTFL